MMKHSIVLLLMVPVLLLLSALPAGADQHKKEDVTALLTDARSRIDSIRNGPSADLVRSEIAGIDESCAAAQGLLEKNKIDEAFAEISVGLLYFKLIDARIDLQKALVELDETKKNLSR